MQQLTSKEAIEFAESKAWEKMDYGQRARFQFAQEKLCMPFGTFHEAIEKTLGRPVFTHEIAMNREGIQAELNGTGNPPTFEEIVNLIPSEKRIICVV